MKMGVVLGKLTQAEVFSSKEQLLFSFLKLYVELRALD
jgi:hypothetical protein